MSCSLTALVENTPSEHLALGVEHGLSLFVETPQTAFIFDCGSTGLAWRNAVLLNVKLRRARFAAVSHAHYDHAGGFPALLRHVSAAMRRGERSNLETLYTGPGFWEEKFAYTAEGDKYTYLGAGFGKDDLDAWGVRHEICDGLLKLDDYAWLVGNFERRFGFETIPARFVRGANKEPDDFGDEICLALREGDGVAVITGCAHPGILNIVTSVHERLGLPVTSVVGGTHLKEADEVRIDRTLTDLRDMGMRRMALCHCSGSAVRERLRECGAAGCLLSTGDRLEFN
ncbi:MAG: MBL fold metallo-hydrolase [Fretibacterium sp.]|nr:MBL fold metallo-hydrolase [Fretibacterium sp.]